MTGDDTEYIKLKVVRQVAKDTHEIHFRVKQTTQMGKLMKSYSERVRVPITKLWFLFDGRRINDGETPKDLEMKQDDVIVVHQAEVYPWYQEQPVPMGGAAVDPEYIKLRVVSPDYKKEIHFRVKKTTQLGKMKKSYYERVRAIPEWAPITSLRFLFNGQRINDAETPKALKMKQDDVIVTAIETEEQPEMSREDDGAPSQEHRKLETIKKSLECPVCWKLMRPPTKIWMCRFSHGICEVCKDRLHGLGRRKCPTCFSAPFIGRNYMAENLARTVFNA